MANKEIIIPSSPEDRKKLKESIDNNLVQIMAELEAARECMTDAVKGVAENFDLPPKVIRRMAKLRYNRSFSEESRENEEFETLYESILDD